MRYLSVLLLAGLAPACAADELDRPIDEVVSADYALDNRSDRELLIRFETAQAGQVFWAGPVAPGERLVFASDALAGGAPAPSDTFAIVELAAPGGAMLYTQEPIDDDLWALEEIADDQIELVLEIDSL